MHATQAFALLALAGSTLAFPGWGGWSGNYKDSGDENVVVEVQTVTAYTTVTYGGHYGGHRHGRPTQTAQPDAVYTPSPEKTDSPPPSGSKGNDGTYMGIVNEWRGKMGLSDLSHDSQLEGNAEKTAVDGNGQMVHQLNSGSMAQVLAPGSPSEFEKVFVGGWLCEMPNLPGLDGICDSMSAGWSYDGQTGHAEILKSGSYSKIGCACAGGIWGCDLA